MRLLWFLLHVATAADPDPLRERIYAVSVQAAQAYTATEYTEAHARGLEAQALAKKLPKRDPFRLTADLRVADALFGLDRYEEAAVIYQGVVDLTERQKTIDEATLLIEAASNLGITHHQLGDLAEARVWHQTAWELIQFHQLFTPLRFLVANQYAVTAIAQADYEAAVTLRTWILTSVLHEFGEDHVRVAAARLELASVYGSLAAWPEAAALLEQARSIYERDPSHAYMLAETDRRLAEVHCAASEVELAVAALERSTRGFRSIFTDDDPQLSGLISTSANVATLRGDLDAASGSVGRSSCGTPPCWERTTTGWRRCGPRSPSC